MILTFGCKVLTASATPAMSPPPPVGTTTASMSCTCSTISSPSVPCPAMMWGWSKLKDCQSFTCPSFIKKFSKNILINPSLLVLTSNLS